MKIAFTGTSSTGKTTTARQLISEGCLDCLGLHLCITSDTRKTLAKRITDLTDAERITYQSYRFEDKLLAEREDNNFIAERSFVDLLAYRNNILPSPTIKEIEQHISLAKQYSLHFYFPHGVIPYIPDGYRPDDEFALKISNDIRNILDIHNIRYVTVDTASLQSRCDIIVSNIINFARHSE